MLGAQVRMKWGRNKGQVGTVTLIKDDAVYVDFNREVLVNEGFGSYTLYPDGYWSKMSDVDIVVDRCYNSIIN